MHKTFLCAHTHRKHQPQIQHAKCVRLTSASPEGILVAKDGKGVCPSITNHFNHCCVSGYSGYSITAAFQGIQSLLRFSILVVKDGKGVYPSITNHFNHCCVSGYFVCEGLKGCDLLQSVAQRSMRRTKQSMYIERARARTHTIFRERERAHTRTHHIERERAHTHTHTIYFTGSAHTIYFLRFLCSCAEAGHMQMSGHGLPCCAAIDDSRKVEYTHRQYSLQNTLNRNCNLCNER